VQRAAHGPGSDDFASVAGPVGVRGRAAGGPGPDREPDRWRGLSLQAGQTRGHRGHRGHRDRRRPAEQLRLQPQSAQLTSRHRQHHGADDIAPAPKPGCPAG